MENIAPIKLQLRAAFFPLGLVNERFSIVKTLLHFVGQPFFQLAHLKHQRQLLMQVSKSAPRSNLITSRKACNSS